MIAPVVARRGVNEMQAFVEENNIGANPPPPLNEARVVIK